MASLLSRCRPDCPIFAFTTTASVRRRLNLQWGLIPFRLSFSDDMESNLNKTFSLLKARGMIKSGDLVIAVSDMLQSIQVMNVPQILFKIALSMLECFIYYLLCPWLLGQPYGYCWNIHVAVKKRRVEVSSSSFHLASYLLL